VNVTAGEVQDFSAIGYDQYNNIIPGLAFNWSTDIGSMTGMSLTAQTKAPETGFVRATIGPVWVDSSVAIIPAALDHIDMTPAGLTATAGMNHKFSAVGRDVYNNAIPGLTFNWTTTAGTVDSTGMLTTQTAAPATGTVYATIGDVKGTTAVVIIPDQLTHILVTPEVLNVTAGTTQAFNAVGYDQYNNTIPGLGFNWTTNVGTMNGNVLTAQTTAWVTGYVHAYIGTVISDPTVLIVPAALDHIDISPMNITVVAGLHQMFTATGKDRYNNTIPGTVVNWTTTVGNITSDGLFTAQDYDGNGYIEVNTGQTTRRIGLSVTTKGAFGTISGTVWDEDEDPSKEVTIEIIPVNNTQTQSLKATVDQHGKFSVTVPVGNYTLNFSEKGGHITTMTGVQVLPWKDSPVWLTVKEGAAKKTEAGVLGMSYPIFGLIMLLVLLLVIVILRVARRTGKKEKPAKTKAVAVAAKKKKKIKKN
jgi:hypothetical protein